MSDDNTGGLLIGTTPHIVAAEWNEEQEKLRTEKMLAPIMAELAGLRSELDEVKRALGEKDIMEDCWKGIMRVAEFLPDERRPYFNRSTGASASQVLQKLAYAWNEYVVDLSSEINDLHKGRFYADDQKQKG